MKLRDVITSKSEILNISAKKLEVLNTRKFKPMLCEIQPNVNIKTTHTTNGLTLHNYHFSTSTGITTNQRRGDRAFPDGQLVIPLVLQPFHYLPAQANHRTVNGYVMLMTMSNTWKQAKSCEKLRSLWAKTSSSATAKSTALQQILSSIDLSFTTGLITRTLGPSNGFTLLNGCTGKCVRLSRPELLVGFWMHFKSLHFHSFHSFFVF